MRVVQPRVARPHRILKAAEQRQAVLDEGLQGQQRLRSRHGPGKAVQSTRVVGEAGVDERDDLERDGIRLEAGARRHGARAGGAEGLAVVSVEVPLATNGLIALHQDVVPLALLAIEILHAQRLAAFGMRRKVGNAAEEMAILSDIQRQAAVLGDGLDRCQHAPIAGRGHHQAGWLQTQDVSLQLPSQTAGVARHIQPGVVQRSADGLQIQREVAHGRQEHRGARFARPHMGGLVGDFGHPNGVAARIETVECRCIEVKLVAQHHDQRAQLSHAQPCCAGRRRSSTSRRPSSWPTGAASSWPSRSPRRAC